jgi:hypothetical protein
MTDATQTKSSATAVAGPVRRQNTLPAMIGALVALALVATFVWLTQQPQENSQPPPAMPKSVAEIKSEMAKLQANKDMPESQKQMIMGYLKADLKTSEEWEAKKKGK